MSITGFSSCVRMLQKSFFPLLTFQYCFVQQGKDTQLFWFGKIDITLFQATNRWQVPVGLSYRQR